MAKEYQLQIKTVRHSQFADEYEGRAGLTKLPYKMLLQQSEIRNGQLQSEIDELRDTIDSLKAKITDLQDENKSLRMGVLREYTKELRKKELYTNFQGQIKHLKETIESLRRVNRDLIAQILTLKQH